MQRRVSNAGSFRCSLFTDETANQSVQLFVLGCELLERSLAISAENGRRPAESCDTVHGVSEASTKGNS